MRKEEKMKKLCVSVVACLIIVTTAPASAQEEGYRVSSVTVSSGEDTVSSGITGIIDFTNKKNGVIEIAVQHDQAWFFYGRKFKTGKLDGSIAASVGHHQGAPWAGPMLTLSVPVGKVAGRDVALSTLQWPGFYGWEPRNWKDDGIPNPESVLLGYLGSVRLDVGPVGFVYSYQNFLDSPWNQMPGVAYTANVNKEVSVSGSSTWNANAKNWMLYVGLTWKPKHGNP